MIHVSPADEPPGFNQSVRMPGLRAIAELVGDDPEPPRTAGRCFRKVAEHREDIKPREFPTYWVEAIDDLMTAYRRICAYSCFRIHPVTGARSVDHMAPKSRSWDRVYEWGNYRLCSSRLNARKNNFGDVLDPFEVKDGWFVLELFGFQVLPAPELEEAAKQKVLATIDRLGLNKAEFRTCRERDVENYEKGVPFVVLAEESPFVARELRRQGRLRPEDA